jgi:hypothetical protein
LREATTRVFEVATRNFDAVILGLELPARAFLVVVGDTFLAAVDLFLAGAANAGTLKQNVNTSAKSREHVGKNVIVSRDSTRSLHSSNPLLCVSLQ